MAYEGFVITKVLHVFFAVGWVGAMFYQNVLVMPTLMKISGPARGEFQNAIMPLVPRYGNIMGGFTLLTGIGLVSMNPYGYTWGDLMDHNWGRMVSFALVANVAILYLTNFAIKPTAKVLMEKMKEVPPGEAPPQGLMLLQKRIVFTSRLALIIALAALAAMVVANGDQYLRIPG